MGGGVDGVDGEMVGVGSVGVGAGGGAMGW